MPDPLPSCFRAGAPPDSTAAGPTLTTSVYDTPLGLAALSWSRTLLGLSLRLHLRLPDSDEPLRFLVRPWLLWRRRGRRRLPLPGSSSPRHLLLSWDLSRAVFPTSGGPEPSPSSFSLSLSLDSRPVLLLGDQSHPPPLISRRDHALIHGSSSYSTTARFAGKDHQISIEITDSGNGDKDRDRDRDAGLVLSIDGDRVLQVRRIRWKFRGSERADLPGGDRIRISWDLHKWFFAAGNDSDEVGRAVFLIRFEKEEAEKQEGHFAKGFSGVFRETEGYFGKSLNWSDSSSGGGGGGENGKKSKNRKNNKKTKNNMGSLLKTSSWSSSSSASSASGSSVMEWASAEEAQLRAAQGFSLLVYAWKS